MDAEEVFVNRYSFNPSTEIKKGNFKGISLNFPEPGPEPQFRFSAPQSQIRKNYFWLHNTDNN
jgi:hypothetical protein